MIKRSPTKPQNRTSFPIRILDTLEVAKHNPVLPSHEADPHELPENQFESTWTDEATKANTMILSGDEIRRNLGSNIEIDPFNPDNVNPNSYNLTLHQDVVTYEEVVLDMRKSNRVRRMVIPESGLVLEPNRLYLGRTVERTETHNLVPMIEGRSSIGRLGLFVHVTAGFGDVGFKGFWTLEMFAVQPVKIYPGVSICQIFYHQIDGDIEEYCSNKYQDNTDIQPSLIYKELNPAAVEEDSQLTLGFPRG